MEAGSWKLEAGSWKLEAGSWKLEAGSWKLEGSILPPEPASRELSKLPAYGL
ncbi:phosphotransferase [Halomonas nitroreducens]|uniref:Phosphotransferase n=1 Tax=Halomonas nitroreducens TaxID=447425 RepID=A0A431V1B3_9GAMM|nr:phosphotransferase [Halomonas nitroreducens]